MDQVLPLAADLLEMMLTETRPSPIPRPANEADRLAALAGYGLLDTAADADFDLLAEVAAELCGAPYAFVSLVDADRVWHKASFGAKVKQVPRDDDYCSWTVLEDRLLHIPDLAQDARTRALSHTVGPPGFRMYSGANLITSDGYRVGALCVLDTKPRTLGAHQLELLVRLARQVVALMELRQRDRELALALSAMQRLASEDGLTGLMNRRALIEALQREVERSRRMGSDLSVVMIDLDHFKAINDRHGHAMGDAVLRGVGSTLRSGIRAVDIAGRYGGEELCLVLPETHAAGAVTVAESLRVAIAAQPYEDVLHSVNVTASFGVAAFSKDGRNSAEQLLRAADEALYRAKTGGRNRVVAAA
ncbi:MAG TPA: sensor domain-containing diguanylate cyclase [Burkholderiaceae bacterium]|nr:sensor domain-containing diguanylate cyclase [Burkholderiaceae bacterium]